MIATLVNTNHNSADDCNTVSSALNMNHMASMLSGKLIMVPMTVSLIASRHAALFLNTCNYINYQMVRQLPMRLYYF